MKAELLLHYNIEVSFTNKEVKLITKVLLASEYKWEAYYEDGFWNTYCRVRKLFRSKDKDFYRELSFRQLDKILKAFEPYMNGWLKDELADKIIFNIRSLLNAVNKLNVDGKGIKINFEK